MDQTKSNTTMKYAKTQQAAMLGTELNIPRKNARAVVAVVARPWP